MSRYTPFDRDPAHLNATQDAKLGALLGLAIGDALGACVEFKGKGTFKPVTGYRTGTFNLTPGEWTDDTACAIALGHSLKRGFNLGDQLNRYTDWRNHHPAYGPRGCFDIGGATSAGISVWDGGKGRIRLDHRSQSLGNGSIMRLAPVAVWADENVSDDNLGLVGDLCALSSVTTHPGQLAQDCCRALGLLLGTIFDVTPNYPNTTDDTRDWLAFEVYDFLKLRHGAEVDQRVLDLFSTSQKVEHARNTGFCLDTLHAALAYWRNTDSFEAAVLLAANGGGDSDTVAAVTGQIAGAYYGAHSIPDHLLEDLQHKHLLADAWDHLL